MNDDLKYWSAWIVTCALIWGLYFYLEFAKWLLFVLGYVYGFALALFVYWKQLKGGEKNE